MQRLAARSHEDLGTSRHTHLTGRWMWSGTKQSQSQGRCESAVQSPLLQVTPPTWGLAFIPAGIQPPRFKSCSPRGQGQVPLLQRRKQEQKRLISSRRKLRYIYYHSSRATITPYLLCPSTTAIQWPHRGSPKPATSSCSLFAITKPCNSVHLLNLIAKIPTKGWLLSFHK